MSETQTPSYEQLQVDLRANQISVDVTRVQRNAALNEVADLAARLDQVMADRQRLVDENTVLAAQVADLTVKLAALEPAKEA